MKIAGGPQTIFRWAVDRCAPNHIPDAPARAFRDSNNTVRLIAAHHMNRAMTGPTLAEARVDCSVIYQANRSKDPAALDDLVWLTAYHTLDGKRVVALGHAEFHGHTVAGLCASGRYMACWRNSVIAAVSEDGGKSFTRRPGMTAAAATLPYPYDPRAGRHTGYFSPSNIVRWRNHAYVFVFAEQYREQRRGACLLRAEAAADNPVWRAWDGRRFTIALNGIVKAGGTRNQHICVPVPGIGSTITSVVRHAPTGTFLALFAGTRAVPRLNRKVTGIFYVQSKDLVHWSPPALLLERPIMFKFACGDKVVFGYPSLIDGNSPSRNFDTVGEQLSLYLTRFNLTGCKLPMNRDLVRYPVHIMSGS
ncbi:MAG: hypothetical protein HOM58_18480 [Rhodospirillaceae bacterium]|nr:hypothetical protein [Rhodospirillaceae bacterium]MBT5457208.1 hypothetical protein [Rhodospirillaceae bacterium]